MYCTISICDRITKEANVFLVLQILSTTLVAGLFLLALTVPSEADFDDSHESFERFSRSSWDFSDERDDSHERGGFRS